jgi:hypothetical protein
LLGVIGTEKLRVGGNLGAGGALKGARNISAK